MFSFIVRPTAFFCAITQANETGDSQQTELEGAKRCFAYLQQLGLSITIFVRLT